MSSNLLPLSETNCKMRFSTFCFCGHTLKTRH